MGRPVIGIMGLVEDDETRALAAALTARGARPWVLDVRGLPEHKSASLGLGGHLRFEDRDLRALRALYIRISGYNWPYAQAGADDPERWSARYAGYRSFLAREVATLSLKESLLRVLSRRIPVVNPQPAQELHRLKLWQLHLLRRAGVRVPASMAANDWAQARAFARQVGPCVEKPAGGVLKTLPFRSRRRPPPAQRDRPILVQEYYPGRTIRCYVVGGRLIAAGQILHGDAVDSSIEQSGVAPVTLPRQVQRDVLRAVRVLGLSFAGVDVQHDLGKRRYAVLECNISPMFVNFARMTGIDIPGAVAELLIDLAKRRPRR